MANILFDFDGTIANTTQYHKIGWAKTLFEIKLSQTIDKYLPYEKGILERFDSYQRIKVGFLSPGSDFDTISTFFEEDNCDVLSKRLLDLKESFTVQAIIEEKPVSANSALANNVIFCLEQLKSCGHQLGILSSSRKAIICAYIRCSGLSKYFSYIMGEEDMTTNEGILLDKPARYGAEVILRLVGSYPDYYIGDSETIDSLFAQSFNAKFLKYSYSEDANLICRKLC